MIKKVTFIFILLVALAVGAFFYVAKQVDQFVNQPLQLSEAKIFTLKTGTSFGRVLNQLVSDKLIKPTDFTQLVRRFHPELTKIKAGTYLITPEMNLTQALELFKTGKEHQFSLTFVEGSRFSEWRTILENAPYLEHKIKGLSEADIAKRLGLEHDKLEGLFLAETFNYTYGTSDLDILERSSEQLQSVLDKAWQERQEKLPLTSPYEALILASIIEKETAVESERDRVASVFVNRLNMRMRLQTDPTVIYGMGDAYDGNIRKKDLRTRTAYNTYVISGLPPTPIAMAGEASILAALNPESSKYI